MIKHVANNSQFSAIAKLEHLNLKKQAYQFNKSKQSNVHKG